MSTSEELPARWTGIVQAHANGGFVAYGDYLKLRTELEASRLECERLRVDAAVIRADEREKWAKVCDAAETMGADTIKQLQPGELAKLAAMRAIKQAQKIAAALRQWNE